MQANIELTIPAKAEYLSIMRLTLNGIASDLGFSYDEIEDIKIAVGEACNNVVLHAYEEEKPGLLELQFEMNDYGLSIHVKDRGLSFNYDRMLKKSEPLHDKSLSDVTVGGLGMYLMNALMDRVQVLTDQGTEIILTKQLTKNYNDKTQLQ